jgi:hypothetical protein
MKAGAQYDISPKRINAKYGMFAFFSQVLSGKILLFITHIIP